MSNPANTARRFGFGLACLLVYALLSAMGSPAHGVTYTTQYEMSVPPVDAPGVLDADSSDVNGPGFMKTGAAGSGSTFAGGILHYVDNSASTGNLGYYFADSGVTLSFTIDMLVKVNAGVTGLRSMGFSGANGTGNRGLRLNTGSVQFVDGSGGLGTVGNVGLGSFTPLRVTYNAATNMYRCYRLDTGEELTSTNGGGSGVGSEISNLTGYHIGALGGSSTSLTDFEVDYFRVLLGTAVEDGTSTIDLIPPPSCISTVTPINGESRSGFVMGILPAPAPVDYNFTNLGNSAINYSVSKITASGDPTTYSWLDLSDTAGQISPGQSKTITATLNTAGLTASPPPAFLKFEDGCPLPPPAPTDDFAYPDGALNGNDGWSGTATQAEISVVSGEVKVSSGPTLTDASLAVSSNPDGLGVISVKAKARAGAGSNTIWSLWILDDAGKIFGRWYGSGTTAKGRDAANTVTATQNLSTVGPGTDDDLETRIYTASNEIEFFFNGASIGRFAHGAAAGDRVGSIRLERTANAVPSEYLFIDDLEVAVLAQHVRRIDLNLLGCSIKVQEPRVRTVGPCGNSSSTTEVFTILNDGAYDWTDYNAIEDPAIGDRDWLALSFAGGVVPRGATATVTAVIDWTLVPQLAPGDGYKARIRFRGTCGGDFAEDTPAAGEGAETLNVVDYSAPAQPPMKLLYQGDVLPGVANSAGGFGGIYSGYKFELWEGLEQGSIVSDAGTDGAVDGLAYRLQDLSGSGLKTKWRSIVDDGFPGPPINPAVGATALARVKVVSTSPSFRGANLSILEGAIDASYYWGGIASGLVREVERTQDATVPADARYHILRITSQVVSGSGTVVRLYFDEDPVPKVEITNASSAGTPSAIDAIGFGAGSSDGAQEIYFDWVSGTNAGAFAPGQENDCIGSLLPGDVCNVPLMDADGDQDVDTDDFGAFQLCYTGLQESPPPLTPECGCFDANLDNSIAVADFNKFVTCATGPGVLWSSSPGCPN